MQTASHEDDRALQASVQQFDAQVQQAVAAYAAGPNPVLPQDPALAPTQGMDWLERMRAEDAALRAAMESNDAQFRPPKA